MASVLAVFAHPDDEVLGAGGTLRRHADEGDETTLIVLGRPLEQLVLETRSASELLGITCVHQFDLPDQRFETLPLAALVEPLERLALDPDLVYTHWPGDLNLDHALTARAVLTYYRPLPGTKPRTILACEIPSSSEYSLEPFPADWYVSLSSEQLCASLSALACYQDEIRTWPHPRSSWGLSHRSALRGSEAGFERAEAFCLLRHAR